MYVYLSVLHSFLDKYRIKNNYKEVKAMKKFLILLTSLFFLLLVANPIVSASSNGAYGVEVTDDYVHVDGAKCSCSLSDGYYYHYNITFVNKCPYCGGKLAFEEKSYWVEGLWYCTRCDMDFCLVHGKEHGNSGLYLTPCDLPAPAPQPVLIVNPVNPTLDALSKMNGTIKVYNIKSGIYG
jgi:hypothetical protein